MKLFKQCLLILGLITYGVVFSNPQLKLINTLSFSVGVSLWLIIPWIICNKIKGH